MYTSSPETATRSMLWLIAALADAPPVTGTLLDDSVLVRQAQQDLQQFTELYERHVSRVYRYLLARVGNVADAQDLTHIPHLKNRPNNNFEQPVPIDESVAIWQAST